MKGEKGRWRREDTREVGKSEKTDTEGRGGGTNWVSLYCF